MKRTTSASVMAAVLVTPVACAPTETTTTTTELTDAEIENVMRRSYQ